MDKKPDIFDFHQDKDSTVEPSDDTVHTDFTQVASCIRPDDSEEAKNRKIKANQVREFIATKETQPLSIKQKLLRLIGFK